MLSNDNPHSKQFQALLGKIKQEVDNLKAQVSELRDKNHQLKAELEENKKKEADIFSSVKETDRMALKHQIKGLISKIDEHLEDQA
ncbi:MAG: hypothetical protein JXR26_06075 [Balneolaceae bacterium]|nr:hypothetical protein [Balneolaceae bacterium]